MSSYKLNVSFSDDALRTIYAAGQKLALVKAVQGNAVFCQALFPEKSV